MNGPRSASSYANGDWWPNELRRNSRLLVFATQRLHSNAQFRVHRAKIEALQSADTDLLAIRFPDVYEEIGGKPVDWDHDRFAEWRLDLDRPIALIVEVKTGGLAREARWWRLARIRAAIRRLGIVDGKVANQIAAGLEQTSQIEADAWIIAKLLVTNEPVAGAWLNLTLDGADTFIANRIRRYKDEKDADRLRFPDDLMQYLAWKS
jgi:hypothetical protein